MMMKETLQTGSESHGKVEGQKEIKRASTKRSKLLVSGIFFSQNA